MRKRYIFLLITTAVLYFLVAPVYSFYAHKYKVPMLFASYSELPDEAPTNKLLLDERYKDASQNALDVLESHRQYIHSPGISAAVAIDGRLVWAGGAGWSNVEEDVGVSIETQFRIGSTSKAVNALLLAKLVENRILSLDAPLSDFELNEINPLWANVTPRQLASHTSGLPHYKENTDVVGLYRSIKLSTRYTDVFDSLEVFDSSDVLFEPGESFSYSSLGTVLLSAVMQKAAKKSYQALMQELVFEPLGTEKTMPEPESRLRAQKAPDMATFYWRPDYWGNSVTPWREVDLSHRLAGGGFISTSSDLVKLGLGFMSSDFISSNTREVFWTPQTLNSGEVNEQRYALGWRVRETDFGENIGKLFQANHGGVSRGAQSWLMVIPDYQMAVAVNINANTDEFWEFGKVAIPLARLFILRQNELNESDAAGLSVAN